MNKPDLGRLYRRFTRNRRASAQFDVDALVAIAEGDHSERTERLLGDAGRSALHADLVRFARALQPESARLGVQLERSFETSPQHRGSGRHARSAAVPRRALRIATALAACFVAAIVVWSSQHNRQLPAVPVAATKVPDRIFAALGDEQSASVRGDRIFRGDFAPDRIFKSDLNGS